MKQPGVSQIDVALRPSLVGIGLSFASRLLRLLRGRRQEQ